MDKKDQEAKKNNIFYFSKEELDFLQTRQLIVNQYKLTISDLEFVMQQFIIQNTLKRLNIDPGKNKVNFDIAGGTIEVEPIIATNLEKKIIIPK